MADKTYNLTLLMSDGSRINAGNFISPEGPQGPIGDSPLAYDCVASYKTAGSYTWTVPEDGDYFAVIVGGGGSGAIQLTKASLASGYRSYGATGGKHGKVVVSQTIRMTAGDSISVVVGAGGVGRSQTYASSTQKGITGAVGGSSAWNGVTAAGGSAGNFKNTTPTEYTYPEPLILPYYLDEDGFIAIVTADGGDAWCVIAESNSGVVTSAPDSLAPNGLTFSSGVYNTYNVTESPTAVGAGSGATTMEEGGSSSKATTTPNGADGAVFIYKRKG